MNAAPDPRRPVAATRRILTLVLLLLTLVPAMAPAATTARQPAGPLDLAAMTLLPADLADIGLPGFIADATFMANEPGEIANWDETLPRPGNPR